MHCLLQSQLRDNAPVLRRTHDLLREGCPLGRMPSQLLARHPWERPTKRKDALELPGLDPGGPGASAGAGANAAPARILHCFVEPKLPDDPEVLRLGHDLLREEQRLGSLPLHLRARHPLGRACEVPDALELPGPQ